MDGAHGLMLLKQEVGKENIMVDMSSNPCRIMIQGGGSNCLGGLIEELQLYAKTNPSKEKPAQCVKTVCVPGSFGRDKQV